MATTADPRGSPPDPMFSTCYTSSHHARLNILPPLAFQQQDHPHASSSAPPSQPQPVHDEEAEVEENEETLQQQQPVERPWNLRSRRGSRTSNWEKKGNERAKFSVSLSAEEIEEDVYAVTGSRPRRRPKRRPRVVQRQLDALFPGMLLTEITVDSYKVPQ